MKRTQSSILTFFIIYFSFTITSNLVHPVTPAFLQMMQFPSYMQGVAYSAMSFFIFFTSPFWGRMGDRSSYAKMMAIGYFGYALGQLVFSLSRAVPLMLFARLISGTASGALQVNSLAYLVSCSNEQNRGKYLAIYAALQSVGTSVGYFAGGLIGDYNVLLAFYVQVALVAAMGGVTLLILRDPADRTHDSRPITLREVNPVSSMITSAKKVDAAMGVFLATVFCFGFAMMAHDNYFGYFLQDQLGFPPSVNGYFKAVIGVIAIIANSTINMWITKHTDVRKSNVVILGLCSVSLLCMVSLSGIPAFLATALTYYTLSIIVVPVLQVLMMKDEDKADAGTISGLFNALLALGKTAGPLAASVAYSINPIYPFILAAAMYALAAGLGIYNRIQYKNRKPKTAL